MMREMNSMSPRESFSDLLERGGSDPAGNKREQLEALMRTVGLSEARIKKHMDQLEK